MNFIDPKTSFAFQRLFGATAPSEIPLSLFNALLEPPQPIAALDFSVSERLVPAGGRPESATIARAHYEDGSTVLVDARAINLPTLKKRLLFNAAKTYCSQLNRSPQQPEILPIVALAILDFEMFDPEVELVSRFTFCETEQQFPFPAGELQLIVVELPKFTKTLEELETAGDCWLYFLRHAPELAAVPEVLAEVPAIAQAFALADESKLTRDELDLLQQELLFIADQRQSIDVGLSEGLRRGVEEGRDRGRQEGIEEGREEGRQAGIEEGRQLGLREGAAQGKEAGIRQGRLEGLQVGQLSIVRRLLSRRFGPIEEPLAAKIEKLSAKQLESLAEAAWDFITTEELAEWLDQQA